MFPYVVDEAKRIIEAFGAHAHARRRTETAHIFGLSLRALREHLLDLFPEVRHKFKLSIKTIHYWMLPARKDTYSAERHRGLINARPQRIENSHRVYDQAVRSLLSLTPLSDFVLISFCSRTIFPHR